MIDREKLLFYDLEVTSHDALAVFMDVTGNEVAHFWNNRERKYIKDPSGFEEIPDLIHGKVLVGYNNYFYDDIMLTLMMNPAIMPDVLKAENDRIINGDGSSHRKSELITSLDTMQQIDVSHPSLKQIEGNMGLSIVESPISFDIGRPLTDDERNEMLRYCRYDVKATIEVFKLREKSYFEAKVGLLEMLPEDGNKDAYRWNTTTLSATVLLGNKGLNPWIKHKVPSDYWRNVRGIPSEVWDMWENCMEGENVTGKGKTKTIKAYDCNFVFGMGGLHGAPTKPGRFYNVKHKDVASMYPSSIVHLNALGDATALYDQMRNERIAIKKSNPAKAGALKIILNSVYGNFKNSYSKLFNPLASATVCIYGQIALFSLCRDLYEAGYKIINANTDGVVYDVNPELNDSDERICQEWEQEFSSYKLETDYFKTWIQRDVNNYIAVEENGKITVKGGDVNKYEQNKFFSNNSARIVQIALVNKLVYGTHPFDTFLDNLDKPLLWQYILKAGNTYKGVQDKNGDWQNKVNRVFACVDNPKFPHTKLYKIRWDDGQVNFPDVPELMFLWNEDVSQIPEFSKMIDQNYYYGLVMNKLKGWV